MNPEERELLRLLAELELELRRLGLWGGPARAPAAAAFESRTPFFLDTLEFHQWLEYVLISRLRALVGRRENLPRGALIAPCAEEYYRGRGAGFRRLIGLLRELDSLLKA